MALPGKPMRKTAPAGTMLGKATGGVNVGKAPAKRTASAVGKGAYNRQGVGLNPTGVPMRRTPDNGQPGRPVNRHPIKNLKGVD